jgi:hypothetical protein
LSFGTWFPVSPSPSRPLASMSDSKEMPPRISHPCSDAYSGIVRGAQVAFAEKQWLLIWAHKLTKNKRNLASFLHFVAAFALSHPLSSHFTITLDSRKDRTDIIFMTRDWNFHKEQWNVQKRHPPNEDNDL